MSQPVQILLVEDNPNDIELTLHAFRKNKLSNRIEVVHDGEEALEYLFCTGKYADRPQTRPRLILLDLKLPKIDGLQVLKRIKSDPDTRKIPVVVLTSSKEQQDIISSYDLGVNSYIRKPVDFEQFNQVVSQLGFYWLLINEPFEEQ